MKVSKTEILISLIMGIIVLYELLKSPLVLSTIYVIMVFTWLSITLVVTYTPKKEKWGNPEEYEPSVTIIVPTYNEEKYIRRTIKALLRQHYPQNKLEIIVVNDGSTDKTLEKLREFGDEIQVINLRRNGGKREAICHAIQEAKNEIIVHVDSDSILSSCAIKNVVQPFVKPEVGATTGNIKILNRNRSLVTRLQDTWYYTMLRFNRSTESYFKAVTCCSGIIAAYRAKLLKERIHLFKSATFLGRKYIYGDDRDLTNLVLRDHDVVYVPNAIAYTPAPSTISGFIKQQIRWKKGWLKGTSTAVRFMYKKKFFAGLYFYLQVLVTIITPIVIFYSFMYLPLIRGEIPLLYLAGIFLLSLLYGIDHKFHVRKTKNWKFRPLFGIMFLPLLNCLLPYVILSLLLTKEYKWKTR